MNTKHTPGPIVKIQGFDASGQVVWEVTGSKIAQYRAAPKLLEAMQNLDKFFDSFTDGQGSEITGPYLSSEGQQLIDQARAAIKEATK